MRMVTAGRYTEWMYLTTSPPYNFYTAGTALVTAVPKGTLIHVDGVFEATNDLEYNVMVGRYMDYELLGVRTRFAKAMTENVTPAMHHGIRPVSRGFLAPITGDYRIRLVGYAASTAANSGDRVHIDYVDLAVEVHD